MPRPTRSNRYRDDRLNHVVLMRQSVPTSGEMPDGDEPRPRILPQDQQLPRPSFGVACGGDSSLLAEISTP